MSEQIDTYPAMKSLRPKARQILRINENFRARLRELSDDQKLLIASNLVLLDAVVKVAESIVEFRDLPMTGQRLRELEGLINDMKAGMEALAAMTTTTSLEDVTKLVKFSNRGDQSAQFLEAFRPLVAEHLATSSVASLATKAEEADKVLAELSEKEKDAEKSLVKIRSEGVVASVSRHASNYKKAGRNHNYVAAGALLLAVIISSVVVPRLADAADLGTTTIETWPAFAAAVFPRLPYGIIFVFGLVLLIKVAVAERHNAVVAAQKSTALETFETFTDAAKDDVRHSILLTTTSFIFSSQGTAYTKTPVEIGGFKGMGTKIGHSD